MTEEVLTTSSDAEGEPRLVVTAAGASWALRASEAVMIGREPPAQIRIADGRISRAHARVEFDGVRGLLVDAGSTNGVYLDGCRVDSVTITDGVVIHFGDAAGIPVTFSYQHLGVVTNTAGTIDSASDAAADVTADAAADEDGGTTEFLSPTVRVAILLDAAEIAVNSIKRRLMGLPASTDATFPDLAAELLDELRRWESTLAEAVFGSLEIAGLLSEVRKVYAAVVAEAVAGGHATRGQRLFAARQDARLSIGELAGAVGIGVDVLAAAEADRPLVDAHHAAVSALIAQLELLR